VSLIVSLVECFGMSALGSYRHPQHWPTARWIAMGLGRPGFLPLLPQPVVDLLGTEIGKGWMNQRVRRQRYPIADKDRVDRIIRGLIPQFGVPLATPTVVCESAVHDLMSKHALQFSRR